MILTITLNAAVDHILFVGGLKVHDTNRVSRMETDAGGKGVNLSRVAVELGARSMATGFLGGGAGAFIKHVLLQQGVACQFVESEGETRTNMNVESGDGPPTTFNARGPEISELEWSALVRRVEKLCQDADWVAMGGSLPPGVPTDAFRVLVEIAKKAGCRVVLDADGEAMRLGLEAGPDFIKPNVREAERLLERELFQKEAEIIGAARDLGGILREKGSDAPVVVISRGALGAVLFDGVDVWKGFPVEIDAKSTIGSGDSMLGGMLFALESGMTLEEAFRWGLAAGAATALTDGTEIGRKQVILDLMSHAKAIKI